MFGQVVVVSGQGVVLLRGWFLVEQFGFLQISKGGCGGSGCIPRGTDSGHQCPWHMDYEQGGDSAGEVLGCDGVVEGHSLDASRQSSRLSPSGVGSG